MQIIRCSRFGTLFHPGEAFEDAGRVLVVERAELRETRKWADPSPCPVAGCGRWIAIDARPATDSEIAAYRREEAEKHARLVAYRAKVAERRAAWLAKRNAGLQRYGERPGVPRPVDRARSV